MSATVIAIRRPNVRIGGYSLGIRKSSCDLFYNFGIRMDMMQKHQKARFLRIRPIIIYGLFVLAQTAWCGQVDSEKIDLVLRDIAVSKTSPHGANARSDADPRLLSVVATIQTRQLGAFAGIKDWDEKNPKWKPIHDHIRADLEKDLPTLPAADAAAYAEYRRCEAGKCYAQEIASTLQPADVDAILAYFDTPEGKRFQAFQQQIDSIYSPGVLSVGALSLKPHSLPQTAATHPNSGQDSNAESITPSDEQMQRFWRMLKQSVSFQSTKASTEIGKPAGSGNVVFRLFLNAAIDKNRAKLGQLDLQCRNDLPGFEAFMETDAARHLIEAMGKADAEEFSRTKSALDGLQRIANTQRQDWRVLFKSELSQ